MYSFKIFFVVFNFTTNWYHSLFPKSIKRRKTHICVKKGMRSLRLDIDEFDGNGDIKIWSKKISDVLVQ